MAERIGNHTILLPTKPSVYGYASVVGKAESEGPLAQEFDKTYDRYMDTFFYLYKEDPAFREKATAATCYTRKTGDYLNFCAWVICAQKPRWLT